ncbi:MAG: substrate-binding domain-containing protein [Verrucomicrobiota bacterium]|nr:substrate-binding domain-containing protein [Verrucomicrobiota bacterium]
MKQILILTTVLLSLGLISHAADTKKKYTIAVIPKGTTHEFWKSIHAGAEKAGQELKAKGTPVEIIWKGPLKEDDREQQVQVVESFVGRKVDGIVLAPLDSKALVGPVEMATSANIPVVIIDSGLESTLPVSMVTTDNHKGGQQAGEYLGKILNGKGNVIMQRYAVGSASTTAREAGFLEALKKFPDIKIISMDQYSGPTRETAYQAAQNLLNRHGKNVQGVFTPNESSTAGMTLALKDAGFGAGKVKHIGFDASTILIDGLKTGDIQGLVVQDPFQMGYLGVMTLFKHLTGEKVNPKTDTAVQLVTKENLDTQEIKDLINPPLDQYLKGK